MRKAYRITGSSFNHPGTLPEGFTVKERLVGESLTLPSHREGNLTLMEVKDGSVVVFVEGVSHSQIHFRAEDIQKIFRFMGDVAVAHPNECLRDEKVPSKCPGTPHRGHSASDWSCPLDRT